MKLFVVGCLDTDYGWGVIGVFDSAEKAEAQCTEPTHFVGPCRVNRKISDEEGRVEWPGAYFPMMEGVSGKGGDDLDG